MKPKEKALELVNKFRVFADGINSETDRFSPNIEKENGKKCALISAVETKFAFMQIADYENAAYWRAVELELEKL